MKYLALTLSFVFAFTGWTIAMWGDFSVASDLRYLWVFTFQWMIWISIYLGSKEGE